MSSVKLAQILRSEGFFLLRKKSASGVYDIEMTIPYDADGSPVDSRWFMDLGPSGAFAEKLDLDKMTRGILKRTLREKVPPKWKGPKYPKLDGKMVFRGVTEEAMRQFMDGASWYGIRDWVKVTPK